MPLLNDARVKLHMRQERNPSGGSPSPLPGVNSALTTSYCHTLVNTIVALAVLSTIFFTLLDCLFLCWKHKTRTTRRDEEAADQYRYMFTEAHTADGGASSIKC